MMLASMENSDHGASMNELKDKCCVVTGGGTGIGRGVALRLAQAGAHVAITGRRAALLAETKAMVEDCGVKAWTQTMDVTDKASVAAGFKSLAAAMGPLHLLVNNAGMGGPNACAVEGPDTWTEIMRTNLDGMYFCTCEALPNLADGGRVINISSVLGKFGVPGYTAYCASKHGVIGFTKALALELAPREITVNAICPGWVDTIMAKDGMQGMADAMNVSFDEAKKMAMSQVPMGRIIQPEEIGGLVVYLASQDTSAMTGQAISLCGGSAMGKEDGLGRWVREAGGSFWAFPAVGRQRG